MAKPRQPIDSEREDISRNHPDDTPKREAGPLELEDEDLKTSEDDFEDEEDMDY